MENRDQEAAVALLKVFAMLKFTPGEVMKMGSLEPLVEMFGVEREDVPGGLRCLSEQGLVVKEGHFNWCLTELGCEKMREASA